MRISTAYQFDTYTSDIRLAQDRLVNFWAHFGGRPLEGGRKVTFSDFSYTEMVFDIEPGPDAITIGSDPYMIIRPEGDWDRPGVLDRSAEREVMVVSPCSPGMITKAASAPGWSTSRSSDRRQK